MKVTVKVFQGQETTLDVTDETSIKELKQHVSQVLKVPVSQQKLLLTGKPLSDEKCLTDYPLIKDGVKINLVVKKPDENVIQLNNSGVANVADGELLKTAVINFLRTRYTENDAQKIADEFVKNFFRSVSTLNLEDIERIATSYYADEDCC